MSIQITSTSTHLIITNGANIRRLNKQVIREISVLRDTTLKIDIGGGALRNVFLSIAEITAPDNSDQSRLVELVNAMLSSTIDVTEINNGLASINSSVNTLTENLANSPHSNLQQPTLIDESNPNSIYTGFAIHGASTSEPTWAIMRTTIRDDIQHNEWSNGTQEMNAIWNDRTTLAYA